MLSENNKAVFEILKSSVFHADARLPQAINWNDVFDEMSAQTVTSVAYEWVENSSAVDADVKQLWKNRLIAQISNWMRIMFEQESLFMLLKEKGIQAAVLKGTAASVNYPKPEYRVMGDVDFLVKKEDFQRTYQILLENGYSLSHPEGHVKYHITLRKNGVDFELHNAPAGMPSGKACKVLEALMNEGLDQAEIKEIESFSFPVLPRLQNGLVLLLHIVKHLHGGMGIRQIMDWMLFADKNLPDEVWCSEFQPVLKEVGLEELAIVVTRMCQIYLGLGDGHITWCASADDTLCENLLNYFMDQGNFGRKTGENDKGVRVLTGSKDGQGFFSRLQENGKRNWKLPEKYAALNSFAWCYQIIRYIRLALGREKPVATLLKEMSISRKRKKMFDQLQIYQSE